MIASLTKFGLVALCSSLLVACAQSPTGRSQMLLYSPQQMNQLGADSFEQMKKQEKVSKDAKLNAYVSCVAKAVTAQVPASYGITNWEVVVFDSKQVNAFALPGGKIGVYSGLLKVAKNQDQLATVIGHELTHGWPSTPTSDSRVASWRGSVWRLRTLPWAPASIAAPPWPPLASGSRWG